MGEIKELLRKTCPSASLSTKSPTCTDLGQSDLICLLSVEGEPTVNFIINMCGCIFNLFSVWYNFHNVFYYETACGPPRAAV
jgi:hypothetical protein